jgi:hypothetical protein
VVLGRDLAVEARVKLGWPGARAVAVSDAGLAYVTHYLTEEPGTDAHVSVVDLAQQRVVRVFAIPADLTTCETRTSGQGVLNLLSAIAIVPAGPRAGQIWVGGTRENVVSKGLFKRFTPFRDQPGAAMFPGVTYEPFPGAAVESSGRPRTRKSAAPAFPTASAVRNTYAASLHDVTRFGIVALDPDGNTVGGIDIDGANDATDIELSPDGATAYVVDQMFNSYHVFSTARGQDGDPTTVFGPVSRNGPGGVDPPASCIPDAFGAVGSEGPFRRAPQAQLTAVDGYDPVDANGRVVRTGVDFDTATYMSTTPPRDGMRPVPDGVGTAPIGVRLSADGSRAYVANYLARNVVPVATAEPLDRAGRPADLRCQGLLTQTCGTNDDCPAGVGFCNHPGGAACGTDADCGDSPPCLHGNDCVPVILGPPVATLTGGLASDALPPAVLDGKILFNTAARDPSVSNGIGRSHPAPLFNDPAARVPGSVVSTSHDASHVTCSTCHADFGGQDGRTWDFRAVRRVAAQHHGPAGPRRLFSGLLQQRSRHRVLLRCRLRRRQHLSHAGGHDPAQRVRRGPGALLQPHAHRALERGSRRGRGLRAHPALADGRRRLRRTRGRRRRLSGSAGAAQPPDVHRSGRRQSRPGRAEPQPARPRRPHEDGGRAPVAPGGLRVLAHRVSAQPEPARRRGGARPAHLQRPADALRVVPPFGRSAGHLCRIASVDFTCGDGFDHIFHDAEPKPGPHPTACALFDAPEVV